MNPPGSKQCPNCGTLLPVGANRCSRCGANCPNQIAYGGAAGAQRCPNCQAVVPPNVAACPNCHQAFANPHWQPGGPAPNNPLLYRASANTPSTAPLGSSHLVVVALVSVFLGGFIGQMLNRQVSKGVWVLIAEIVLFLLGFVTCGITFLIGGALEIVSKVDAIMIAAKLQNGQPVSPGQWF